LHDRALVAFRTKMLRNEQFAIRWGALADIGPRWYAA
jgi:hypothetical protein